MTRRHATRRGILLLIVLSLLVLFVLIGLTFVVVANQYNRSARVSARVELTGDAPSKELDGALYLLMRGSRDPFNLTHRHNLLGDLYGNDGFIGTILAQQAQGELIKLEFRPTAGSAQTNHYYAGAVFTFLDGVGRGHSTRIVRYTPDVASGRPTLFIAGVESLPNFLPAVGDRFLVNGIAFNGTGDGYNPGSQRLDAVQTNYRESGALMPNLREGEFPGMMLGGSDESWDAADYQNYFLARIPSKITPISSPQDPLIPSFHRPFLVNYWWNRFRAGNPKWDGPDFNELRRFVISRPLPQDHPLFTGSNPAFEFPGAYLTPPDVDVDADTDGDGFVDRAITRGPWDVDNDNDGIPDSIWVDLGMPVKTSPDGRLYKPLFAILCVDLDGRLNLNAHDNRELATIGSSPLVDENSWAAGGFGNLAGITRGAGYGPAEIRLSHAIPNIGVLLSNRSADPTTLTPGFPDNNPSVGVDWLSHFQQWDLPLDYENQFNASARGSAYQAPSDLRGIGGVYLDLAGQPRYALMGSDLQIKLGLRETSEDPYECNLVTPNASDELFTVADQEQILRAFDADTVEISNAPMMGGNRLRSILYASSYAPASFVDLTVLANKSRLFTTHSFDIPTPNIQPPNRVFRELLLDYRVNARLPISGGASVSDMVRARLIAQGFAGDRIQLERQVQLMVPTELRKGQRMDINRWLGNSRDDNGNLTVDEPSEDEGRVWTETPFETQAVFALDDPLYKADNIHFARQQYARHLYCLMMLLNTGFEFPATVHTDVNPLQRRQITARRIAQWAINVVDFRDPDAIMSPFEFDLDPFDDDGWSVDDDIRTPDAGNLDRGVVWGCEFPELLITETAAFHDRRVRDTRLEKAEETEIGGARERWPIENQDADPDNDIGPDEIDRDLDQFRVPQGSLFLELYCTRNRIQNNKVVPNELYDQSALTGEVGLDLERRAPDDSPVWRIGIVRRPPPGSDLGVRSDAALLLPALPDIELAIDRNSLSPKFDPNDEGLLRGLNTMDGIPDVSYERFIYFTRGNPNAGPNYFNRSAARPLLVPGQYAVIGPRQTTYLGSSTTVKNVDGTPAPSQQLIQLNSPMINLTAGGIYSPPVGPMLPVLNTKPVLAMIAAADVVGWPVPVGVSVSEPLPGPTYYQAKADGTLDPDKIPTTGPDGSYYEDGKLPDKPLDDIQLPGRPLSDEQYRATGTHRLFRVAVLERLADPTSPWDARTNPYVPVDSQPIDLTVFNGEEVAQEETNWDMLVQKDPAYGLLDPPNDPNAEDSPAIHFESRERGNLAETRGLRSTMIWNPVSTNPGAAPGSFRGAPPEDDDAAPPIGDLYWNYELKNSFGYLNSTYGALALVERPSYGNVAAAQDRLAAPAPYIGDPRSNRIPWLVWNNRPFVSHLELMQVPSGAPWRLLYEFRGGDETFDSYDGESGDYGAEFTHLLNFFHSSDIGDKHANFSHLLDYLEVPSRFVGTQRWLNPQVDWTRPPLVEMKELYPPFNRVSRFRDPGRININTIPDEQVWNGVDPVESRTASSPTWADIEKSLMGEQSLANRPAFYANPVRTAASADLMPLRDLEQDPANATLLRSIPGDDAETLFGFKTIAGSGQDFQATDHNSYFRYHKLQRLGNLLTTHSNVYAVWITVGYFEVHPWNRANPRDFGRPQEFDPAHPDGYQLGLELGNTTGQVKRHRAFYMIDRSIPVAYEPGENHNIERAIVLRRMLE